MEEKWYRYYDVRLGSIYATIILIPFVLFVTSIIPYDQTMLPWLLIYLVACMLPLSCLQYLLFRRKKAEFATQEGISACEEEKRNQTWKRFLSLIGLIGFIFVIITPLPVSLFGWALFAFGAAYLKDFIPTLTVDSILLVGLTVAAIMFVVLGAWGVIGPDTDAFLGAIFLVNGALLFLCCFIWIKTSKKG